GRRQVAEMHIHTNSKLRGQAIAAIAAREVLVLAHLPQQGKKHYLLDVDPQINLAAGDRLIVCGEPRALVPLLAESEGSAAPNLLWASRLRRWSRIVQRALVEIERPVLVCTVVFLFVVVVSTLVLHFGVQKYTLADSLLHTIGIMSAGGS